MVRAAFAHHKDPQRRMWHVCAQIDGVLAAADGVEIVWKALPVPGQALGQGGPRDVFDPLEQADQEVMLVDAGRREADAAVAHRRRGDSVDGGWGEQGVPGHLAIVVGVNVDEAGGDMGAVCVDDAPGRAGDLADLNDQAVLNGHVGASGRRACAVDHDAIADDCVQHV